MAASSSPLAAAVVVAAAVVGLCVGGGEAQLCEDYYDCTCPDAYDIVRRVLIEAQKSDTRIFASLIRLHFHDCFVQGCDASLLLDTVSGMQSEKESPPNNNSARGFDVVDNVRPPSRTPAPASSLAPTSSPSPPRSPSSCFRITSGGPGWGVLLGRLDGKTSNFDGSLDLPAPTDNLTVLQGKFLKLNLNDVDLVALSGGHTFGRVQCQFVTDRLYNFSGTNQPDPTLDATYRAFLSQRCPQNGPPAALNDLDPTTPDTFDNNYYTNIEVNRGVPPVGPGAQVVAVGPGHDGAHRRRLRHQPGRLLHQLRPVHDQYGEHRPAD
ncbi:hypothetical protein GUJ93_ZPchr0275g6568 [Zizania palustris]|uniref:Plant heme peroxidase family profile domain-containing protein n=1 Tax=Zizania palustris TaxID=103762 RepID=A0A8J5VE97_ZIZPA|nr:hypothetical protein GUJ93_ZPchr0275g6568 [Zizania palustris]